MHPPPHFASTLSQALTAFVKKLQEERPEKELTLRIVEENLYWCVRWKSKRFLDEYFKMHIWSMDTFFNLNGEHHVRGLDNHYCDEYFSHKNLTERGLASIQDKLIADFKNGVLQAIDTDFDDSY